MFAISWCCSKIYVRCCEWKSFWMQFWSDFWNERYFHLILLEVYKRKLVTFHQWHKLMVIFLRVSIVYIIPVLISIHFLLLTFLKTAISDTKFYGLRQRVFRGHLAWASDVTDAFRSYKNFDWFFAISKLLCRIWLKTMLYHHHFRRCPSRLGLAGRSWIDKRQLSLSSASFDSSHRFLNINSIVSGLSGRSSTYKLWAIL